MLSLSRFERHGQATLAQRMAHFLLVAASFPSVLYTVLLGVVLAYWVFVMVGAASVDLLGDGGHGSELGDVGHGHDVGDGHGHDVGDAPDGAFSGMLAALRLRAVPVTVALSAVILFSWLFCVLAMQAALAALPEGSTLLGAVKVAALVLSPALAIPVAALAVRPLAGLFAPPVGAQTNQELVGKLCTVRTGSVTDRFGEATVEGGGSELVVRVRVASGETLGRGDQAVIIGYDDVTHEFTVAPLDDVMNERRDG